MRILLAGVGFVGEKLAELLLDAGHEPIAVRRSDPGPRPYKLCLGDLANPETLAQIEGPLDALVYLASPDRGDDPSYQRAYIQGLSTTLSALTRRGDPLGRTLLTTSTAVYGEADGGWVDETTPTEPSSFRGRRLLEAENILLSGPFSAAALRLGGIYGPGRTGILRRVREQQTPLPTAARYSNRIHRDDAARAIVHLLLRNNIASHYNVVDSEPADLRDVIRFAADILECPLPAATNERGSPSRGHKRVSAKRLQDSGFHWNYPSYREGYRALLPEVVGS